MSLGILTTARLDPAWLRLGQWMTVVRKGAEGTERQKGGKWRRRNKEKKHDQRKAKVVTGLLN